MTERDIRQAIAKALRRVAPEANLEELSSDENIREALDIDSFDYLNVLIALNEELGVEIPEKDYSRLATLADLVRYLSTHAPQQ